MITSAIALATKGPAMLIDTIGKYNAFKSNMEEAGFGGLPLGSAIDFTAPLPFVIEASFSYKTKTVSTIGGTVTPPNTVLTPIPEP